MENVCGITLPKSPLAVAARTSPSMQVISHHSGAGAANYYFNYKVYDPLTGDGCEFKIHIYHNLLGFYPAQTIQTTGTKIAGVPDTGLVCNGYDVWGTIAE